VTERELVAIEQRLAAATPGPWDIRLTGIVARNGPEPSARSDVAIKPADAALIASVPTDLAALCAEVRRLRAALGEARALLADAGEFVAGYPAGDLLDRIDAALRVEVPGNARGAS
jgi:hypothetical protein